MFASVITVGCLVSIMIYYFLKRWYDAYDDMLKHADGEWRDIDVNNDYSDETVESKVKYYVLFDWYTSVVFSFLGTAMIEVLIMPKEWIRYFTRLLFFFVLIAARLIGYLILDRFLYFTYLMFLTLAAFFIVWFVALFSR